MSETPTPAADAGQTADPDDAVAQSSFPARLGYAIYGAMSADFGCLIGAIAFFVLIAASAYFAPQITPCTSAGGIPCAP
jgi:hypothetical protein